MCRPRGQTVNHQPSTLSVSLPTVAQQVMQQSDRGVLYSWTKPPMLDLLRFSHQNQKINEESTHDTIHLVVELKNLYLNNNHNQ